MRCRCRSGAPTTSTGSRSADAATISASGLLDGVEQGVLQQDVLDRVPGQRQLGKNCQRDAVVVAFARPAAEPSAALAAGSPMDGVVRACGDADEAVAVGGVEVHFPPVSLSIVA